MSTVLARVPLERISAEARQMSVGRGVLLVLGGVLFVLGWLVAKAFTVTAAAVVWCAAAVKVGWKSARSPDGGG